MMVQDCTVLCKPRTDLLPDVHSVILLFIVDKGLVQVPDIFHFVIEVDDIMLWHYKMPMRTAMV